MEQTENAVVTDKETESLDYNIIHMTTLFVKKMKKVTELSIVIPFSLKMW
jgi:hypothetical protein